MHSCSGGASGCVRHFLSRLSSLSPTRLSSGKTLTRIFCVASPKPRDCGFSPNCDSILPQGLCNSWGTVTHDKEQWTFFLHCSSFLDWLAHLLEWNHGIIRSLYPCPLLQSNSMALFSLPAGECHHATCSEHSCLAKVAADVESGPNCV